MTGVCALVLTRNRKVLLGECLEAVLAQTFPVSRVVVLDNASSDGTAQWLRSAGFLDSPVVQFVRSEVNLGGAGGYAEMLGLGDGTGADWLWLMDDDAEPHRDALERLLASPPAQQDTTVALASRVVHLDGSIDLLHRCRLGRFITPMRASAYAPGTYAQVDCASFVGLLVRAGAARKVGLPRREFFLGYDDADYSLRLAAHGDIRLVPESSIIHKIVIGGGERTARSLWCNRVLRASYTSSPWEGYWKDLYRLRNLVALKTDHTGLTEIQLASLILGYMVKTLLYDRRPLRRWPWIIRFALRGRRGDFRAPSPEAWSAYARATARAAVTPRRVVAALTRGGRS